MKPQPLEQNSAFKNKNDHVLYLAMQDTAKYGLIALPIIMVFEAYMMGMWIYHYPSHPRSLGYPICYILLFLASSIVFAITKYVKKDMEKRYKTLRIAQDSYALLFIGWALAITTLDAISNNFLSVIVYMTVAILVPVMCFIPPLIWLPIYCVSGLYIGIVGLTYRDHFVGFLTNFIVFSIMAFVAQYEYYTARKHSFLRQIELLELARENYKYAYVDSLTGLLNRRSYTDRMDELEKEASLPADLIIVSFDVNGLKRTNDSCGHLAGDKLLTDASRCMQEAFSEHGSLYRTGGDEFMAILTCSPDAFAAAARRFHESIAHTPGCDGTPISVSMGSAAIQDSPSASLDLLAKTADDAMYLDKRQYYSCSGIDRRRR